MKQGFSALVVDDDDFSRHTAVRILTRLGAGSVAEAADGNQALLCAHTCGDGLDLIVCDLKMPRLDGIETMRGLAEANLSALIVLASGADARTLRSARDMAAKFGIKLLRTMKKPVTLQKLRDMFGEVGASAVPTPAVPGTGRRLLPGITADELRHGFEAHEFVPYFQPKVAMATKRVVGAEALVRWVHPVHGVLPPGGFLADVQRAGLFDEMTAIVFTEAAARCATWRNAGLDLSVSVNLPIECLTARDLPKRLEAITAAQGLDPEHMIIEVTEDGWLQHEGVAREVLTRLRLCGFGLSIDDFGTGYSTMQQLLHAPFSEIKIDQCFVRSAPDDEESAVVLTSIIELAHRLQVTVVAEGAETAVHWNLLERAGCDLVQGYHVARPMPGGSFAGWVAEWEQATASPRSAAA